MPLREAKAWRVYRYQKSDSEHDGKWFLALWVADDTLQGVAIHPKPARSKALREIEAHLTLDFLPRKQAHLRFDTPFSDRWGAFTTSDAERNWVVTGRTRYQVLAKALSAESRLPRALKSRLLQENRPFLNHWAKRIRP